MTDIKCPSERIDTVKHSHTAATTAKTPVLINSLPMIPLNDADANAENVFVYRAPYVEVDKATGATWTVGQKIYWDDTNKVFTHDSATGSNPAAGFAAADALSADAVGYLDLNPTTFL